MSKIGFISLGCAKALVDSEMIISTLNAMGYDVSGTYETSDLIIINTCGFLNSAIDESKNTIAESLKQNGKVIVTGCLGYKEKELKKEFPSLLGVTKTNETEKLISIITKNLPPINNKFESLVPQDIIKLTPKHYAYLKIAEGCNNSCTFCIIPQIRGKLISKDIHKIMQEAMQYKQNGAKELLIIAQDTATFGKDLGYSLSEKFGKELTNSIIPLCDELASLDIWVRLHYLYPYPFVNKIIEKMAEGKILPYADIPLQHSSPKILKAMKRPAKQDKLLEEINSWRKICNNLIIRSTFIVGFPDETEEDFNHLLEFIKEAKLDKIGCFKYENVAGAKARELQNQIPEEIKEERWHILLKTQMEISKEKMQKHVGKEFDVLIDYVEGNIAVGRSYMDSPEVDGTFTIENPNKEITAGNVYKAIAKEADEYNLKGFLKQP